MPVQSFQYSQSIQVLAEPSSSASARERQSTARLTPPIVAAVNPGLHRQASQPRTQLRVLYGLRHDSLNLEKAKYNGVSPSESAANDVTFSITRSTI